MTYDRTDACFTDSVFDCLPRHEIVELARDSRMLRFCARSPIAPTGEGDAVYLVADGILKAARISATGKEAVMGFYGRSQIVRELAILRVPMYQHLQTLTKTAILRIPVPIVRTLMVRHPDFAFAVLSLIGRRRRRLEDRLQSVMFGSVRERLIRLLLDLSADFGIHTASGELRLGIPLSHQELASSIGSTRETATIALGGLRTDGHLRTEGRHIVLRDTARLRQAMR